MKVFNLEDGDEAAARAYQCEAEFLSDLNHPNIVKLYGTIDLLDQMDDFGLENYLSRGLILEKCRYKHFGRLSFFKASGKFKATVPIIL